MCYDGAAWIPFLCGFLVAGLTSLVPIAVLAFLWMRAEARDAFSRLSSFRVRYYSLARIFTLRTPFSSSIASSILDTSVVVLSTWTLMLNAATPLIGIL